MGVEARLEGKCRDLVRACAGTSIKTGQFGWPDRLFLFPGGRLFFVEFKAPGKKPTKLQEAKIRILRRMGFQAHVIDNLDDFKNLLTDIILDG